MPDFARKLGRLFIAIVSLSFSIPVLAADALPNDSKSATQMTKAAQSFVATLNNSQRNTTVFPLDAAERAT